ncbi:hypothetical protein DENSPDRAFT_194680 [Dentipellis sp. KUC8613]|nr:hypothetical protein DENSPDRAFT_194680 [Dentipellis sp. KUC8613]
MLTLEPCSLCDVCADEYGPRNPPHCIPCGHVLCLSCCNTIIEKTPSRLQPVCPFCREQFTRSTIRLIRIDFNGSTGSGFSTPRRSPRSPRAPLIEDDFPNDLLLKANLPNLPPLPDDAEVKSRTEVRRLESRIARIAAKKCSVEEVTALHKELRDWLDSNSYSDAFSSIHLSSLLLHAILANHVAFTESSKNAKNTEATLKSKVDELELEKSKLEAEIQRHKLSYTQKTQECQNLRAELARLKVKSVPSTPTSTTSTASASAAAPPSHTSVSRPTSPPSTVRGSPPSTRVSSPTSSAYLPHAHTRMATPMHFSLSHGRSPSAALPSRTSTPAVSTRSATPASPASPSPRAPTRKGRTLSMSGPAPAFPLDEHRRWIPTPAPAETKSSKFSIPSLTSRPAGPRQSSTARA